MSIKDNEVVVTVDQPNGSCFVYLYQDAQANFHWSTYIYDNAFKAQADSASAGHMDRGIVIQNSCLHPSLIWNIYAKGNTLPNNCDFVFLDYVDRNIDITSGSNQVDLGNDFLLDLS